MQLNNLKLNHNGIDFITALSAIHPSIPDRFVENFTKRYQTLTIAAQEEYFYAKVNAPKSLSNKVDSMLQWAATKEGHGFWSDVAHGDTPATLKGIDELLPKQATKKKAKPKFNDEAKAFLKAIEEIKAGAAKAFAVACAKQHSVVFFYDRVNNNNMTWANKISESFTWHDTEQGQAYWEHIHGELA